MRKDAHTKGHMETKKKVTVLGQIGKNRAEITEEEKSVTSERAIHAQSLLKQAGELFAPDGAKYLGSATIHYYSKEAVASNPQFFCGCQVNLTMDVVEQHADLGHRQLKSALMRSFGRAEPKTRQDV